MPILSLQQRARELGRIRIGQVVATRNGKTRPAKIDTFRVTSPSRAIVENVAALYGGSAREWQPQGGGAAQWEVLTTAARLPVLVPPQPVSQFLELWSGGGCVRRCDGVTELLSDTPCVCDPDPGQRECKPTTRLNVILKDVQGIGVFRLETHGYYAAVELPQAAMFLAQAGGYIDGHLALEARRVKRNGETRDFMVPTLEIDVTPAQLMSGQVAAAQAVAGPVPVGELPAAVPDYAAEAEAAGSVDGVREVWARAAHAGHLDEALRDRLMRIGNGFAPAVPPQAGPEPDRDDTWSLIVAACPDGWSLDDLDAAFSKANGGQVAADADGWALAGFLRSLREAS